MDELYEAIRNNVDKLRSVINGDAGLKSAFHDAELLLLIFGKFWHARRGPADYCDQGVHSGEFRQDMNPVHLTPEEKGFLLGWRPRLSKPVQMDDLCSCGHLEGPHRLAGYADPELGFPTEGWRECPECDCEATWSLAPGLLEKFRELRNAEEKR